MNLLGWAKRIVGLGPSARETALTRLHNQLNEANANIRKIQAGYDAAAHNDETLGLWSKADNLSARLANSLEVRRELRQRNRHEFANGSHMHGVCTTLVNDFIGTGPQLQVLLEDDAANTQFETAWNEWANEICLDEKLHTFCVDETVSGEGTAKLITNADLYSSVKMDWQNFECDRMSTPYQRMMRGDVPVDGIVFDEYGRPSVYHILKNHPGDSGYVTTDAYREEQARNIFHWFRMDRSEQCRGIPLMTPSLLIFAHLREYSAAVLTAARVAACITAIISTNLTSDTGFASSEFTATDLEPGMMVAAPDGYGSISQMKSEQPITAYDAYERCKLGEACHAANLPYSVGTGDFSKESYAGGRMSRQVYHASIAVRRHHFNQRILDKLLNRFTFEASRIPKLLPPGLPALIPHAWFYDPWEHIDETKAAAAITENLANNTTTLAEECAKRKKDWRDVVRQRGLERKALAAEGINEPTPTSGRQTPQPQPQDGEAVTA